MIKGLKLTIAGANAESPVETSTPEPGAAVHGALSSFRAYSGPSKSLDLDQQIRLWFDDYTDHVDAWFDARKGPTMIKAVRAGQATRTVQSGRVLLKLATSTGALIIEY